MSTSKIIKGVVGGGRYTVTAPIIKEDYGLYLQIEGIPLPETYEVDFSNDEHSGTSVTMIGNADGVLIPSQFISSGKDVFAFLYHVGVDFGRTVYKFRIPNKLRPDRTDEEPTPEEQSIIDQAISALNSAVAQTAQDVIDADESAQSAKEDADRAESARDDAQASADISGLSARSAGEYASQASASAQASAQSASQSAQIKSDVEGMVDDAQASASASAQSATASANSAATAQGFAQSASTSATNAHGYASQAQTSAQTASAKAQEASASAQTASQKATESAQSATNASQSAQTAAQAKTSAQTAQGLAESARDLAQGYAEDAQGYANDAQASAESISASASQIAQNTANILKAFPTDTASGSIASFPDGADDIPLKSLVVDIDPVQDLSHGDPSPENICPISGWSEVNVEASGKNLFDSNFADYTKPYDYRIKPIKLEFGKRYVIKAELVGTAVTGTTFGITKKGDKYLEFVPYLVVLTNGTATNFEFTVDDSFTSPKLIAYASGQAKFDEVMSNYNITLEVKADQNPYEPYKGTFHTISLGQTVYGGKLDVLSGELTVYPYYASYNGETLTGEWISDRDKYVAGATPTIGAQVVNIGAQGVTVQLSANQINSLYGVNNLWADSGDSEVEYRANTKLYIEKLTQPEEDDMIADSAISEGKFFMVGNSLYRALANIASGAIITVGTNAQRVSLSDALNLVNA